MFTESAAQIASVIENYFQGIYSGKVEQLSSTFHEKATLFGEIKGQPYLKSLQEYLHGVKNRKSPEELGQSMRMKIISIEILGDIAYAKLHVPMFEFNYYDYLAINKVEGRWVIVNKLFTHVHMNE